MCGFLHVHTCLLVSLLVLSSTSGETEKAGLLRKLSSKMAPTDQRVNDMKWEIGQELSTWWRPSYTDDVYPCVSPHAEPCVDHDPWCRRRTPNCQTQPTARLNPTPWAPAARKLADLNPNPCVWGHHRDRGAHLRAGRGHRHLLSA